MKITPFIVNEHTEFILKQLATVHKEFGFRGSPVNIQSFSDDFKPTIKTNYNAWAVLQFLELRGSIGVLKGDRSGMEIIKNAD